MEGQEQIANLLQGNAKKSSGNKLRGDKVLRWALLLLTVLCSSVILVVFGYILVQGLKPFFVAHGENPDPVGRMSFSYFITGEVFNSGYNPKTGYYEYGAGFLFLNTIILNLWVALLAIPMSVLTALFISKIAPKWLSKIISSAVDLLAAIPSVIFGVFGLGVVVPIVKAWGRAWGLAGTSGVSLLAGAIVLAFMISPTIISVSVTALDNVKRDQIEGSLALGASKTQTNFKICLRSARSGIFAGIILGIGRSLGEATAVSMVCGTPLFGVTLNPFDSTVTLSSEMLLELGEAIRGSFNYSARMSAGILLLIVILAFDLILNDVKNHLDPVNEKPLFVERVGLFFKKLFQKARKA